MYSQLVCTSSCLWQSQRKASFESICASYYILFSSCERVRPFVRLAITVYSHYSVALSVQNTYRYILGLGCYWFWDGHYCKSY